MKVTMKLELDYPAERQLGDALEEVGRALSALPGMATRQMEWVAGLFADDRETTVKLLPR